MKAAEDQMVDLQQNISNIQHFSDDGIRRARQEAAKRRAADTRASADKQAALQTDAGNARAQLANVRKTLWASEAELRKVTPPTNSFIFHIFTSTEEGGYVFGAVCLSVCLSDYSQTCERILTNFFGGVGHGSRTK